MHKITTAELKSSPITNVLASSTEDNKKLISKMEFVEGFAGLPTHCILYEIRTCDGIFITNFAEVGDAIKFYNQMGKDN